MGLGHLRLSGVEQGPSSGPCQLMDFGGPGRERGPSPLWPVGGLFIGVAEAGCLTFSHRPLRVGCRRWGVAGGRPGFLLSTCAGPTDLRPLQQEPRFEAGATGWAKGRVTPEELKFQPEASES